MMISPEGYYERHIKGNNKTVIMREIRALKKEINRLKNILENPDIENRTFSFPTESTQLYWNREYLKKAKEELGTEYVPTKAEEKAEEFQINIPFIKKIVFEIGGFHEGYETRTFSFDKEHLYMNVEHSLILRPTNLYIHPDFLMKKDEFFEGLKKLYIGEWRKKYTAAQYGCMVCDGTQWELNIYYSNGIKPFKVYGDNAYPYNFDDFLDLIGKADSGEDILYTKQFEKLTDYINGMKTDFFKEWLIDPVKPVGSLDYHLIGYDNLGDWIRCFENDVYDFERNNPEYHLNRYGNILEENGLKWDQESMENASVDDLDAQCVLALILGAIRADRFYSGIFLHFLKCGAILRWLERLEEIDEEEWDKSFIENNPF